MNKSVRRGSVSKAVNFDDDYAEGFSQPSSGSLIKSIQVPVFDHTIHITTMDDVDSHLERLDLIRNAGPDDTVTIRINTYGGLVQLAQAYVSAIKESKAEIITRGIGAIASAGTVVFLAGHYRIPDQSAIFMFHNYQGGTWGDGANIHAQTVFMTEWSDAYLRECYQNILTEDELSKILNGGQVWLRGDEIQRRLDNLPQTNAGFHLRLPDGYEIDSKVDKLTLRTFAALNMDEIHYVAVQLGYDIQEVERVPFLLTLISKIQEQSVASQVLQ